MYGRSSSQSPRHSAEYFESMSAMQRLNLSTWPFPSGWYGEVRDLSIFNNWHISATSSLPKFLHWSVCHTSGIPNCKIHFSIIAFATSLASISTKVLWPHTWWSSQLGQEHTLRQLPLLESPVPWCRLLLYGSEFPPQMFADQPSDVFRLRFGQRKAGRLVACAPLGIALWASKSVSWPVLKSSRSESVHH